MRRTLLARSPLEFDPVAARAELRIDGAEPAIVCEEDLSGVLHNGLVSLYAAKEIASQLAAIAPEAAIVIFVRSQPSLAASCYNQYVREGGTSSVHRYLFPEDYHHPGDVRPLKVPRFDFRQFEFERLTAHYDALFGKPNVFVFAFEQFRTGRGIPRPFLRDLGHRSPVRLEQRSAEPFLAKGDPAARESDEPFHRRSVSDKRVIAHIPYWYRPRKKLLERLNRLRVLRRAAVGRGVARKTDLPVDPAAIPRQQPRARAQDGEFDLHALGYFGDPSAEVDRPQRARLLQHLKN